MRNEPHSLQELGARALATANGLLNSLELYEENNVRVRALVTQLAGLAREFGELGDCLLIQVIEGQVFVSGLLLQLDGGRWEQAQGLSERLERLGVQELRVDPGARVADLSDFVEAASRAFKEDGPVQPGSLGAVRLARLDTSSVSTLRARPERQAAWVVATLLDLMEAMAEAVEAGRTPSLIPVKRVVQEAAESLRAHGVLVQFAAAVRDHRAPRSPAHRAVCILLNALELGLALGLPRGRLMALGVAAALDPAVGEDPCRLLGRFDRLGELGPEVFCALHDLHRAPPGCLFARILAVCGAWEDGDVDLDLDAIELVDPLARALRRCRGTYPVGRPVRLSDGRLALVLGWSGGRGGRPVVACLEGRELGAPIDLAEDDGLRIVDRPRPEALGLDLTALRMSCGVERMSTHSDPRWDGATGEITRSIHDSVTLEAGGPPN